MIRRTKPLREGRLRPFQSFSWVVVTLGVVGTSAKSAEVDLAPRLDHKPLKSARLGASVAIQANIVSLSGKAIYQPTVFVRPADLTSFVKVDMKSDPRIQGLFSAEIPATLITGDFDYYVEAFDEDGNGPSRVGSPDAPLHVSVSGPRSDVPVRTTAPPPRPAPQPVAATVTQQRPPERSKAPTILLSVFGGVGAAVAGISGLVFYADSSDFSTAASKNTSYTGSQYVAGQTAGYVTMVAAGAAVLLVAGAITYALWPSSPPPPPPPAQGAP